jgi:putative FmdB family regulatory protein
LPLYELECPVHGRFEVSRRWNELDQIRCHICQGKVKRVWNPTAFSFGWRLTEASHLPGHKDEIERDV